MKNPGEVAGWPDFVHDEGELHPDNIRIKKEIAAKYGEDALWQSWITTCKKMNNISRDITAQQTAMIPEIQYDDVFQLTEGQKERLKAGGCFVIRGAVPKETATEWFRDLQEYVDANDGVITGKQSNKESTIDVPN